MKIKQDGENASVVNVISDLKGTVEAGWERHSTRIDVRKAFLCGEIMKMFSC